MKTMIKLLTAAAMLIAVTGFVACNDEKENTTYTDSKSYAIIYEGENVAAGQTVTFHPTARQIEQDFASIDLLMENKTESNLQTCLKIEKTEGPAEMDNMMVCYGETCKSPTAPWTSDPFTLVPGINEDMLIRFDYTPSSVTSKTTYRFTVAKSGSMADPQVIYLTVCAE